MDQTLLTKALSAYAEQMTDDKPLGQQRRDGIEAVVRAVVEECAAHVEKFIEDDHDGCEMCQAFQVVASEIRTLSPK